MSSNRNVIPHSFTMGLASPLILMGIERFITQISAPGSLLVGWASLEQQVQIAKGISLISMGVTTPGDSCLVLH